MEKDHLEILLEDIQGKFELVLEGHEVLRKEIREARKESNEKHEHTASLIQALNKKSTGLPLIWLSTELTPRSTERDMQFQIREG